MGTPNTWLLSLGVVLALGGSQSVADILRVAPETTLAAPAPASGDGDDHGGDLAEDIRLANELLEEFQRTYHHLDGVTVSGGATPNAEQAVAYFTEGRIVISPARTTSVEELLAHEIWHIIDWRDNGRIDWNENVPPPNWADYRKE